MAVATSHELMERGDELRELREALADAASGHGSVALVAGEPGIGKTALVTRFAEQHVRRARVLWGICDDLSTPRPLGAFRDLAEALPDALAAAVRDGPEPTTFPGLLLDELRSGPAPTVLVLEDVHWADQATIDVITVIGRRLTGLPIVLVLTYRSGELELGHPLQTAIDAVQRTTTRSVELAPLSREAVGTLAGEDGDQIFSLTGGNPFFVIEMLARSDEGPPPSLSNAVLGRVGRLHVASRELLQLIAMVPGRISTRVLDVLEPGWPRAAEQPERRQLIASDLDHVRFRHELTRAAVRSSVPAGRRRLLHGRILAALQQIEADPADLVHHAEAAGATDVVGGYALLAGQQAQAVGANREAFAHYRRAVAFADRLEATQAARLWEDLARSAYLIGHIDEALEAAGRALRISEGSGGSESRSRLHSFRAHLYWYAGDGEAAWREACAAVRNLEPGATSLALARAYARSSELAMLASRADEAVLWARRAMQLSGDHPEIRARAATSSGAVRLQVDPDDARGLLDAMEIAHGSAPHHLAVLVSTALAFINLQWVRPRTARIHAEQGRAYARSHEVDTMAAYLEAIAAWLLARGGAQHQAAQLADRLAGDRRRPPHTVVDLQARTVLTELAVRQGAPDADEQLGELARAVDRTGELKRIGPVLELQVERAITCGRALPVDRFDQITAIVGEQALRQGCGGGRVAGWARLCGVPTTFQGRAPRPHAAMLAGDWRRAADAFGAVGWSHDKALMLSLLDAGDALTEALEIARSLRARPLEQRLVSKMRALELTVPRGPLASTRSNPALLTDRQIEVLSLLCEGHGNAEIARRLHISARTAEHHVAGIFAKLGVSSRVEAMAYCIDHGMV